MSIDLLASGLSMLVALDPEAPFPMPAADMDAHVRYFTAPGPAHFRLGPESDTAVTVHVPRGDRRVVLWAGDVTAVSS